MTSAYTVKRHTEAERYERFLDDKDRMMIRDLPINRAVVFELWGADPYGVMVRSHHTDTLEGFGFDRTGLDADYIYGQVFYDECASVDGLARTLVKATCGEGADQFIKEFSDVVGSLVGDNWLYGRKGELTYRGSGSALESEDNPLYAFIRAVNIAALRSKGIEWEKSKWGREE